jgi:CHAT domain-containing protein
MGNPMEMRQSTPMDKADDDLLPYLAGAEQEIEKIKEVFNSAAAVLYVGKEARKAKLSENLDNFSIIHFATHGFVNARFPWESYLVFSGENPKLTLAEVGQLHFTADLVVLSACESGRGRLIRGQGIWGFPSQFLSSGAKNVVVSLWKVEDLSTAKLMGEFYRAMSPDFKQYGQSLRTAKLKIINDKEWSHPYYWAPFVIYGGLN